MATRISVVEFSPNKLTQFPKDIHEADEIQRSNIKRMEYFIDPNSEIHVFPEYGLYPPMGNRETYKLYAKEIRVGDRSNDVIIQEIGDLAIKYETMIVVDMVDTEECNFRHDGCLYNTMVVFGKDGVVVEKYHKFHLFGAEVNYFDAGDGLPKSFNTSFGRFGMMICFDMMFSEPINSLLRDGIRNIIFISWWKNYPPQLNAIQMQQAFSQVHSVNLLASNSGFNNVSSGSGIYRFGETLGHIFNPTMSPKSQSITLDMEFYHHSLPFFVSKPSINIGDTVKQLKLLKDGSNQMFIEAGRTKCKISYDLETRENEYFMAYAGSGVSVGIKEAFICGILFCGHSEGDCQRVLDYQTIPSFESKSSFEKLMIESDFPTDVYSIYPIIALDGMRTISINHYSLNDTHLQLTTPRSLLSFQTMGLFVP